MLQNNLLSGSAKPLEPANDPAVGCRSCKSQALWFTREDFIQLHRCQVMFLQDRSIHAKLALCPEKEGVFGLVLVQNRH